MKLGVLRLIEIVTGWFQLVAPSGVILREGTLRQATSTWLAYESVNAELVGARPHDAAWQKR